MDNFLYDEDNIDLEETMYLNDLEDEEDEEDEVVEDFRNDDMPMITRDFLNTELNIKIETYRHKVMFVYDNVLFEGYVLKAIDNNKYIWNVKDVSSNEGYKTRMFNINKIRQ